MPTATSPKIALIDARNASDSLSIALRRYTKACERLAREQQMPLPASAVMLERITKALFPHIKRLDDAALELERVADSVAPRKEA